MKKAILCQISYLLELEENESEDGKKTNYLMDLLEDKLCCDNIVLDEKHCADWEATHTLILNPVTMNCGQCYKCHRWTTDRERPNSVEGLCNDATVDGVLLCDECLPEEHPWAF